MKNVLLMLILASCITKSFSQEKYEREWRINTSKVPPNAMKFVEGSFDDQKTKWYAEENLSGKAIEAKVKKNGLLYSIEFDTLGNLKDIEVEVNFNTLPKKTQATIKNNLNSLFSSFKFRKTQIQYHGKETDLKELVDNGLETNSDYEINYEIVIKGKKNKRTDYYEILFNEEGEPLRNERIIQKSTQHLIY